MIVVLAHGAFDVLHAGHIEYLRAARALGDRLFVSVSDDAVVAANKRGRPIMPVGERVAILRELRCVSSVWVCSSPDGSDAIRLFCPNVFVKGKDYEARGVSAGEREACRLVGAEIAYTQTKKRSSTAVIERIAQWREANATHA